jgi:hypothetical protein
MLDDGAKARGGTPIEVLDVAQVVGRSLAPPEVAAGSDPLPDRPE